MLRRLLFLFIFLLTAYSGFAQTFTLEAEQSLNASKDSLIVSLYIQSTFDDTLGSSDFVLNVDTNAVFINQGSINDAGSPYSDNSSYDPITYNPSTTFGYFNVAVRQSSPIIAPGGPNVLAASRTKIADVYLLIRDKCLFDSLNWRSSPPTGAIQKWTGPVAATKVPTTPFILRDSIGGTLNVVPASDTICQGSDVLIELDIAGENNFTVNFTNGTDNYIGVINDGLDTALYTVTGTLTGVQTFSITQITDVNGCVETTAANFTDDDVFIDATVPASNAGLDDSLCLQPKTYMLNGNNPGPAFNGLWTANSAQAVFVDSSQFNTDVTVDTGGYYYFTWTISSLIDGSLGACPSEEDSVRIRFFRQPSPAIIDSVTLNRCITSFPSSIANLIANPLDTGIGTWSIISGPGTASFGDTNNDTTSFTANSAQGTYDVQWEITWGNCPTTNDNVLINFELEPQTPVINSLDGNQCAEIANLDAQDIPLVGNLEFWSTTSSAIIAGTTSPVTTATLPTYTFDSTFTFYWNSQNTTVPGVCPTKQDSVKITRFAQPDTTASLGANNTSPACGGVETYTIANVVAGSNYNWILPGGFTITNSNVDSTFIDVSIADPSFAGNIIIIENTALGCSGGVDTLFVSPTGCQFEASFSVFPNDTICVGDEITLVSNTAGRILTSTQYQWDSTETGGFTTFVPLTTDADTALATFSDPGNWQIRMTASEPTLAPFPLVDDTIVNIVVLGPPDATFVLNSPNTICFGDTVEFQVNITGGAAPYTVDIDTGAGSIIINNYTSGDPIRIVPSGNTTYNLSSVSDGFSCSGGLITSVPTSITVNPLPNLNITTPSFPNLCLGDSILIGFSATGNLPYPNVYVSSSLGGQEIITITGATQNVYFTPSTGGLYIYSIDSVEDSSVPACTSKNAPNISGTATVTVNDGIDSAQFTGGDNICLGDDDTLTVTAFGGAGPYDYFFNNTADISNQPTPRNIIVSPASTTIYTLDSVRDNFGCAVSPGLTQTTTVNPLPAATFTRLAPLGTLCLGDTANFDLNFSAGTFPMTVDFDNDGASNIILVNADTTISIPQTAAGTTSYGINSLSDANGCSESTFPANISVITNDAPVAATITGGDAICAGDNDTLNVTFTGGNPNFSITVTNIGVINPYVSGDDIIVAPAVTTTYTLTNVTDANGCSFDTSASTTTTVNPLPAGSISGTASICAGASTNLTFNFTTGTGPFDVVYTDGVNNFSANGLVSGNTVAVSPSDDSTYTIVSILDQFSGCSVSAPNANITGSAVITVNPNTSPSVSINQSPSNPFCNGDVVTFTVSATDTSASPAWQWFQNDLPLIGQNFSTFISPSPPLGDGDEIKVTLDVSAAGCASPAIVSDSVIIDIQTNITPTVTLSQTPLNPVCNNDTIQLIANITGAGASPLINWYQNGVLQAGLTGLDTISRLPAQWADGDSIRVEVISSLTCPPGAIANATQIINEVGTVVPSVSIVQTPSNPVCLADSVSFEAQFVGGGGSPTFDWYVNGALQIAGSNEFFGYSGSANGDSVRVVLNSSASCAAPATAQDVQIVNKQANVTPVLTVTQTPSGAVCPGEDVAFTSTNSGGGTSPSIQWFVNGVLAAIGDNYTETNIVGATTVEAILTSNATCLTTSTDTFTTLINIQSPITPEVTINQNPNNPVCAGESVTFTTTASGQGSNPTFDWYYNGSLVSTSASYTATSVANGDDIIVIMTSSNPPACSPVNTASDTVQIQAGTNIPLTVNITNDPAGSQFCPGQTVKFSLDASGQGSNPAIQWVSSFTSGTQSTDSTWTVTLPTSQNSYSVAVTVNSSASCVDPNTNPGTFTKPIIISNGVTPTVDIVQTPSNPVCPGENVDFTVNSTGAGTSPLYEWYINGILQTSNSTGTYSSATLNDGDSISVRLITTACGGGTVTAEDAILIQHQNPIIPQVEIIAAPDSVLCDGEFAAFFASATGQGPNPSYKWFVDGTQVSTAITYFTSFTAGTYELVVELTRAQPCGGATIARDTMTVQVNGSGVAAVNIIQSPANPVCNGDPVNFTADAIHVGLSAQYIWIKNGTDTIGSGENITAPVNTGDNIEVRVSFFNPCTNLNSQISVIVTISTSGSITPIVTIVQDPENPICPNETIKFTTIDTAQGSSPSYRWYRNGVLEVLDPTYSFSATTADDTIVVEMISSASCASPSNAFDTVIANFIKTELDTAMGDTTTFCLGDSVTLILEDTNNVSIEWFRLNPSGVDVSLGTNFNVTILETDSVYGVISNGRCTSNTDTVLVTVFEPYSGSITASGATDLCFGDDVTLTVDSTTGYNLQWLYGFDSIAGEIDTFLTVNYTGSFNLIAENNACIDTIGAVNVQVAPPIDSVVSILIGDSVLCEGDSVLIGVPSVRGNGLGARTFNSYVQTPFDGIGANASRSLEAWIITDTAGGIMGYGNNANGEAFVVRLNENGAQGTVGALKVQIKNGYITGSTNITDLAYHHIAVVFDGDSVNDIQLYVDGVLETVSNIQNEEVNTNIIAGTAIDLRIGTPDFGLGGIWQFGGVIDEVRVWDFALDTASIRNNAVLPLTGNEPGLVGLWNFEDTTGGTAKDLSVAGNNGTLVNFARFVPERGFYNPSPPATYEWVNALTGFSYGAVPDTFALWVDSTGDYFVNINNGGCTQTSDTISIREIILDPVITNVSPIDLCFGDNVTLTSTNTTTQLDSIEWLYGGNGFNTNNDSSLLVNTSGSYSVAYFDNGCSDTSNAIIVNVAAEIDTTMTIDGDTALCDGDTTFLSVALNGGNNLRQTAKADVIRDIGNLSDFSFIHESGRFTLQYWQKLNTPNATKINAAVGNAFDGTDPGFFAGYQRGNIGGINLNGQFKLHLDGGGAPWIFHTTGAQKITDTLWHQITIVVDSNLAEFYLDNQLLPSTIALGTPVYATPPTPANNRVTIGDANSFPGVIDYTNRGGVDEVRIWNIPLDSATIANNWYRPLNGNEPGLVALFDLDEDTSSTAGDFVNDLTANAYTGTINGTAKLSKETSSMPTDSLTYQWYNGASAIPGATSNVLAVDTTGSYYVVISTANGLCTDSSRVIDINSYSIDPEISVLNNDTVCFGDSVQLQALNNLGAVDSVRWFYGNYLVDSVSNPYLATLSGMYQAVVFNNVCSDTSLVQNVEVKKAIDSTLSVIGDSVLCADDTVILNVPKYGSSSLNIPVNGEYVDAIGAFGDFDFVHQTGNASFEFWLKLDNNSPRNHTILGNSDNAGDPGFELTFAINGAGDGRLRLRLFNGSSTSIKNSENVTNGSNFDQWNHCVVTLDSGNVNFYFNGVQRIVITDQPYTSTPSAAPNLLRIGGITSNFIGSVDELRIWKTTLTQAQISQNYQRPLNFNNDIVTIFSFDVDSTLSGGDNISDNSGLFTGTMTGTNIQTVADNPFQPSNQLKYQWFQDGSLIPGAEGDSLLITSTDFTDSAEYHAQILDSAMICLPVQSRTIKIKENIISDTLFASPTEFCEGTDSARVWGQLDIYDSVEIYNLQSMTPLAILTSTADTFYVSDTDTVYGVVYNTLNGKICTQNTDTIIITAFENPTVQFANDSLVICIGDSDTLFSFLRPDSVYGGTGFGTYTYNWTPGDSLSGTDSILLQPLYTADTSGIFNFSLIITDLNGCVGEDSIKIVTYDRVVPTFTQDTFTICFNDSLSLGDSLTVTGGKPGTSYKYLWDPRTLFANLADSTSDNPLLVGDSSGTFTYTVIVTDSITNCTGLATITVVVGDSLRFNAFTDTLICFNTDSIQLGGAPTADGGTGIITYSWNPGTNLSDTLVSNPYFINPSLAATYTYFVAATDALGCFKTSDSINIEVAPEILVSAGSDTVLCFGDTTIQIGGAPTASNGFGTFGYQWTSPTAGAIALLDDPNIANPTISYTSAFSDSAIYIVTVYDTSASTFTLCEESDTVIVFFNEEIIVNANSGGVNEICFSDTLNLTGLATGGSSNTFNYVWSGNVNTTIININDSASGIIGTIGGGVDTLVLTAFDIGTNFTQCSSTDTLIFSVNDTVFANAGLDTILCFQQNVELGGIISGTTDTTASGGSGLGFNYNWTGAGGTSTFFLSNTSVKNPIFDQGASLDTSFTYLIEVTDLSPLACNEFDTINIIVNQKINVDPGVSDSLCFGDSLVLGSTPLASGGFGSFSYQWSSQLGNTINAVIDENPVFVSTFHGIDSVTVIVADSRNCVDSASISIEVDSLPTISFIPSSGFYICRGEDTTIVANATTGNQVNGLPLTYTWNNGVIGQAINVSPNVDTTYLVTVLNPLNGCTNEDTINVEVKPLPFSQIREGLVVLGDTLRTCSTPNILPLQIINDSSTTATSFWKLEDPPGPTTIPATSTSNITIFKNQLAPTGNTITNITTDVNGCVNFDTLFITTNNLPNATLTASDTVLCFGDSLTLMVNGVPSIPTPSFSFVRNTPVAGSFASNPFDSTISFIVGEFTPVVNTLSSTDTFEFEVLINTGCQISITKQVVVHPNPDIELVAPDSLCFGEDLILSLNNLNPGPQAPLDSFIWSLTGIDTSQVLLTSLFDTIINVTAYDTNGCVNTVEDTIYSKSLPDVTLDTFGTVSICEGNTFDISVLNPNANYTYQWKDSSNIPTTIPNGVTTNALYTADTSGQFFVVVTTDGLACIDSSVAITLIDNPLPTIALDTIPDSTRFCFGASAILSETSGYTNTFYEWKEVTLGSYASATNTITVSDSGQFYVIITDVNGCIDSSALQEFFEIPLSVDSVNSGSDTVCEFSNEIFTSTVNGIWRLNATSGTIIGANLGSGFYTTPTPVNTISINWNGPGNAEILFLPNVECSEEDTFAVNIVANPVANIQGPTSGCFGDNLKLFALNGGDTYSWTLLTGAFGTLSNNNDTTDLALNLPVLSANGFDTSTIRLIQTDPITGCIDTAEQLITKYEAVDAEYLVNLSDTAVCQFDTVLYQINNAIPNATYTYSLTSGFANITTISNGVIEVIWNTVGTATLQSIAINGDCSDTVVHQFSIQQTPSDFFSYSINGGTPQATPIDTICQNTDSITYRLQTPNLSNTFNWTLQSPGGAATALGALDTTFLSVAINTAGFFFLEMTESTSNGCSITLQETVTISAEPTFNLQVFDSVICETDSVQIYPVSGNFNFSTLGWEVSNPPPFGSMFVSNDPLNNQIIVNWGAPGTGKWVIPTYSNGDCSIQGDTIFVDVEALPNPFITPDASQISHPSGDTIFCQNLRTFFLANPSDTAATYLWYRDGIPLANSDTNALRILESGTYRFRITTSDGGCIDSTDIGVTADVLVTPDAEIRGDTFWCGAGDTIQLSSVNTASNYQWFRDSTFNPIVPSNFQNITVNNFGTYFVVLTNGGNGCTDTSAAFVISPLAPAVSLFQFDSISSFCNNKIIPLYGNNAGRLLEFEWITNGQGQIVDPFTDTTTYIPSDFDSGNVSFEFIVTNFCNEDRSIDTADVRLSPDASYTPSSLVAELEELVTFEVDTRDAIIYSWVFGNGQTGDGEVVENRYNQAGDYLSYLIAVNEFNCEDSFAVPIHVTRNQLIYVPNVFSPNATNPDNKVMRVYGTNISAVGFEIAIFNRWGIKVFESTDLTELKTNGWNGQQQGNGAALPSGVYTYYIKGQFFNQEPFQKVGTVSLIK